MERTSAHRDTRPYSVWIVLLLAIAAAARVGLALASYGSRDALVWSRFASDIRDHGFFQSWQTRKEMNHPPLPVAYAAAAWSLAGGTAKTQWQFCVLLKLPGILADLGTGLLLFKIGLRRAVDSLTPGTDRRRALWLGGAYLLSPLAILISGFHGSTDSVMVFCCLLAFDALDRGRPGWAGLALGAAVNIKLAPLILVPAALALCRGPRGSSRFIVTLSAGALPFIPLLLSAGGPFIRNAIGYDLVEARWGLMYPALMFEGNIHPDMARHGWVALYVPIGKALVWLSAIALAVWQWRTRRFDAFDVAAMTLALVLIFAPGFGVQYLLWPLPLMVAAAPRFAALYDAVATIFVGWTYAWFLMPGRWPLISNISDMFPHRIAVVAVLVWLILVAFVITRSRAARTHIVK